MKRILFIVLMVFTIISCQQESKDSPEVSSNEQNLKEIKGISIDSLKTKGLEITLWVESKKDFEKIHNLSLNEIYTNISSFEVRVESHFSWEAYKPYMKTNDLETWWELKAKYPQSKFVVIGEYYTQPMTATFSGSVYEYH